MDKNFEHKLLHTGQNYTHSLKDLFFNELNLRQPDFYLNSNSNSNSFGDQISKIFLQTDKIISKEKPDKILILGDTNSGLTAILAERMGIPVYHMEAGNRCFDLKVPEEVNRKIIDSISKIAIPYTKISRENLLKEGIPNNRIFVSGNPIFEVLENYKETINKSKILKKLNLIPDNFLLLTTHRAENVDNKGRLSNIFESLDIISNKYNMVVICSIHPRTKQKLEYFNIKISNPNIILNEPFGFFDFVKLEKEARLVLTDSGTVQEECCIFRVPTVTIRDTTERPETVECGSNLISGLETDNIVQSVDIMMKSKRKWDFPEGYMDTNVSEKIVNILGGNY